MVLPKVPICPQWGLSNGCACTPDGGFLYVGSRSINYIGRLEASEENVDTEADKAPIIKVFHTRQTIFSIDVDPGWCATAADVGDGAGGQKYFAALAQDSSVQIWDFDKGCAVSGHKAHHSTGHYGEGNGPSLQGDHVLISYMRNRNVLSVNTQDLVVYCVTSNTYCRRAMFVAARNQALTVLRCSPYNEHIFAVGTSRGLVVIGDLQRMTTIYTLRGHDAAISALSWCPVGEPPWQRGALEAAESKVQAKNSLKRAGSDEIFDIYDYDYLENEFGAPSDANKRRTDSSSDYVGIEQTVENAPTANFDFAEACQSLKEEIDALKQDSPPLARAVDAVTLADCQKVPRTDDMSSSCGGSNESTEGSLNLGERSSSDDGVDVDGLERKRKQQILHQAEVHAAQNLELEGKQNVVNDAEVEADEKAITKEEEHKEPPALQAAAVDQQSAEVRVKPETTVADVVANTLLASAAVDGSFWIWNTQTGAACDNMIMHGSSKQGKNTSIEIAWLSSTQFLTSNKAGDLSLWSLVTDENVSPRSRPRYKFKEEKQHHFQHHAVVAFSVARHRGLLWCISSHREISCENLKTGQLILKYCCASTNVSAMRECPDDMNKIALGFSDRRIGIIDISKMSPTNVYIENFTQRIDSLVLSIAWSPDNKKFAFGTMEGRVGVINVETAKHQPFIFNPICGKPVYSIDWQDNRIFVVCNDILAVYSDQMEIRDAQIINEIRSISSVSVRGDYLFVGTQRGHLQVYRRNPGQKLSYAMLQDLPLAPRYITEIAWSPIANDQLAVVANANNIHILKFNLQQGVVTPMRRIEIKNPKAANACVKWSNHKANEFLTCGFDGGVRVWDLNCEKNNEKFLKQFHCPMTCGLFLPTDEQVVVCAGKSTSVELFDMRVEPSMVYSAAKFKRSNIHALDHVKWAVKVATRPETKAQSVAEKRRNKLAAVGVDANEHMEKQKVDVEADSNSEVTALLSTLKIDESRQQVLEKGTMAEEKSLIKSVKNEKSNSSSAFMKSPATLLYLTTKELNKDVLERLSAVLNATGDRHTLCAKLFGTKVEAKELLAEELKNYKHSETSGISSVLMPQLNATIKDEILQCVQQKQLTEWHVSLAPTISYNFWQKCCQAFAEQLLEQGYVLQAATYMIALHNHLEAVEMLMSKNFFKEALLITRIYMQPDDPVLGNIVDKWIAYLEFTGNFPGAALICVLSGQMNRAYEMLIKVRNAQPEIERILEVIKIKENIN